MEKWEKIFLGLGGVLTILILIIAVGYLVNAGNSPQASARSYEVDAWCEIQEFNMTIMHDWNGVHVTDEDLKPYPEFGKYLRNVNDDPRVWHFGTRLVTDIDCNATRAMQFLSLYRKYEDTPYQPVLEYNGHYYSIGFEYLDAHSTEVPTTPTKASTQTTSPIVAVTGSTPDPEFNLTVIVK